MQIECTVSKEGSNAVNCVGAWRNESWETPTVKEGHVTQSKAAEKLLNRPCSESVWLSARALVNVSCVKFEKQSTNCGKCAKFQ